MPQAIYYLNDGKEEIIERFPCSKEFEKGSTLKELVDFLWQRTYFSEKPGAAPDEYLKFVTAYQEIAQRSESDNRIYAGLKEAYRLQKLLYFG